MSNVVYLLIVITTLFLQNIFCNPLNVQSEAQSAVIPPSTFPLSLNAFPIVDEGQTPIYDHGEIETSQIDDYDDLLNDLQTPENVAEVIRKLEDDIKTDQEIASKSAVLMKMLEDPSIVTLPIVYVEEPEEITENDFFSPFTLQKRSRYYRRYPWKRHSRNRSYEPDARYLCVPSREDVFKLLIGIHENRNGNHHKVVHFCNTKRPARAIFTNIRFIG